MTEDAERDAQCRQSAQPLPRAAPARASVRKVTSNELLGTAKELMIEHNGETYSLRITSKGKLILTK